jgi:CheY-like chemotaxis protein
MNLGSEPNRRETVVLIADDNKDAADSLGAWLDAVGYRVHLAYDGLEPLKVAKSVRPDAAVLDVAMPGATGHEVARWKREQEWGRSMRLVALTAWGSEDMRRLSRAAGMNVHLTKPATPGDVMAALGS